MKYFIISLFLLLNLSAYTQKHEIGIGGGWIQGYPEGKKNSNIIYGGWNAGAYYQYIPSQWIGIQSGLYFERQNPKHDNHCLIPIKAIVFPKFRFSLIGGVYMRNMLNSYLFSDSYDAAVHKKLYVNFPTKPAWGYELGAKWNMKYCRLILSYRQDFSSWVYSKDIRYIRLYSWYTEFTPKRNTFSLEVEIPLWRNKP